MKKLLNSFLLRESTKYLPTFYWTFVLFSRKASPSFKSRISSLSKLCKQMCVIGFIPIEDPFINGVLVGGALAICSVYALKFIWFSMFKSNNKTTESICDVVKNGMVSSDTSEGKRTISDAVVKTTPVITEDTVVNIAEIPDKAVILDMTALINELNAYDLSTQTNILILLMSLGIGITPLALGFFADWFERSKLKADSKDRDTAKVFRSIQRFLKDRSLTLIAYQKRKTKDEKDLS